ncbi:DUF861 domain-containing protein [Rhodococcus sp. 06-156-3C]|uniref:cupin domain-containing protein n=1 Tax=Nocardiaceae TaxID=85025 RepID=UPI0005230B0F|nr:MULTISPECIES: cupin domain-containing protein [Rhodococcus]OZD18268.1 DUF861 domain-containing protein [Rhodococcus sp. 06-156-4C]OZD18866.1 DUF861 domain-containing protein [Rhodococcus sp. 06-156-3C]OZD22376.1 DUF861 domain-containing protein [Rhodococcus sp. 06-156-4a]OZD33960.1 DUF861 domain-containing protein [Rhodococcus sp. 06-156-3b]OZD38697.1 DUF861 domain-containing protein [Rhodococcus sp. 06-156-3]
MNGFVRNAHTEKLQQYSIEESRVVDGSPVVSYSKIWQSADGSVTHGLWEMSAGTIRDFRADESFIVISGRATIEFQNREEVQELTQGSLCVLRKTDPATITVHDTLRKLFAHHS